MKKIIAVLLLIVFVFSLSGCSTKYTVTAMNYYPRYLSHELKDLIENYNNIIVGKVKTSNPIVSIRENSEEKYVANTLHEVEVEEAIFGDLKASDTIYVLEDGDNHIRINHVYFDKQFGGYIQTGDYVILLLNKTDEEFKYVVQGESTFVNADPQPSDYTTPLEKCIVKAASNVIALKNCYTTHPLQGRIWLTEDKQIDQERNEGLLNWADGRAEVIKPGETYEDFVARLKDIIADISAAE